MPRDTFFLWLHEGQSLCMCGGQGCILKYIQWEFTAMQLPRNRRSTMFRSKFALLAAAVNIPLQEKWFLTGWVEISLSAEALACYQWHSSHEQVCLLSMGKVIGQVVDRPSQMYKDRERQPGTSQTISYFPFSVAFLTVFPIPIFTLLHFSLNIYSLFLFFQLNVWAAFKSIAGFE